MMRSKVQQHPWVAHGQWVQPVLACGPGRTVVIGAGDVGLAVVRAFQRRLIDRWGELANVACLAVVGDGPECEGLRRGVPGPGLQIRDDGRLPVVVLPVSGGCMTRREARQALTAARPAVVSTLVEALARVSRLSSRLSNPWPDGQDRLQSAISSPWPDGQDRLQSPEEVTFYVVAAVDDAFGGAVLLDLADLARHLASQRLNVPAGLTGLLLLPDALNPEDPQPALARAYAALRELDAAMSPRLALGQATSNLQSQEWVPAFDQGCYLLGALNADGLGLEEPDERVEFAAEALLQLAVTHLGTGCQSPFADALNIGERPQGYGALGLAAWVYPGRALAEVLARRLAEEILSAWLDGGEQRVTPSNLQSLIPGLTASLSWPSGQGTGSNIHPETLLPTDLLREAGLLRPLRVRLSPMRVRRFRQHLEDEVADRLEFLAARRPELDRRAEALGEELAERLSRALGEHLDVAAPGRLADAEVFLAGVEQHLTQVQAETEEAADAYWKELEALDPQLEGVGEEMDALAGRFPERLGGGPNWRAVLAILLSPRRLLGLILAYRDLARAGASFGALLARQMALVPEVLWRDLAVKTYEAALRHAAALRAQVAVLVEAIRTARDSVGAHKSWGDIAGLPDLCGSLGFVLERCVLTPEIVEALYASVRGHSADLLAEVAQAQGPLSAWLATEPDGQVIAGACLDYARRRCQALAKIIVDDLLMAGRGQPAEGFQGDVQDRTELLQGLVALASPFLGWDETRLREPEHQLLRVCAALGLGEGVASPLLEGVGEIPWAQVVATGEGERVTAMTVVRGLPLAALAGLEEYAAAYRADDPASLHADPDWETLPDPVGDDQWPMTKV